MKTIFFIKTTQGEHLKKSEDGKYLSVGHYNDNIDDNGDYYENVTFDTFLEAEEFLTNKVYKLAKAFGTIDLVIENAYRI